MQYDDSNPHVSQQLLCNLRRRASVIALAMMVVSGLSAASAADRVQATAANEPRVRAGTINLTPEYTHALLTTILSRISEAGVKLELQLLEPLTTNHVRSFVPHRKVTVDRRLAGEPILSGGIGGGVLLTNGMVFEYDGGRLVKFARGPTHDPSKPILGKKIRFTRNQAIDIARRKIQAMGCDPAEVYADLPPEVTQPAVLRGNLYALYYLQWNRPTIDSSSFGAEVWINGETGQAHYIWLLGAPRLPAPDLTVHPKITSDSEAGSDLPNEQKEAACREFLPEINSASKKLGLPIELPVTMASVKWVNAWTYNGKPETLSLNVLLTNGYKFERNADVTLGFSAPDVFFGEPHVKAKEFFGKWKISKRRAVKLAREAAAKLGLDQVTSKKPDVEKPSLLGEPLIPRYLVTWQTNTRFVQVEIEAEKGRVPSLSYGTTGPTRQMTQRTQP